MLKKILIIASLFCLSDQYASAQAEKLTWGDLRLNELQYIGTHNSYHIEPDHLIALMLEKYQYGKDTTWDAEALNIALAYTHVPLDVQLELGIRTFELDVHDDPQGGAFSQPGIQKLYEAEGLKGHIPYDTYQDMKKPGFKVFHTADYDFRSTCKLFLQCLSLIKYWSVNNPNHVPIIIQIEPKSGGKKAIGNLYTPTLSPEFTEDTFTRLENEILSVFSADDVITPDIVRGEYDGIKASLKSKGWPKLKDILGKVLFILIHPDESTSIYVGKDKSLKGKLMFANLWENENESSFVMYTKPFKDEHITAISKANRQNILTYTRGDANSSEARENDYTNAIKAMKSGANIISTDFPFPDNRISSYQLRFSNGRFVQCNKYIAREKCKELSN
jgi:hypothetical protein